MLDPNSIAFKKLVYFFVAALVMISAIFIWKSFNRASISDYEACVAAGNPVLESNPPQCMSGGKVFIEDR